MCQAEGITQDLSRTCTLPSISMVAFCQLTSLLCSFPWFLLSPALLPHTAFSTSPVHAMSWSPDAYQNDPLAHEHLGYTFQFCACEAYLENQAAA